MSTFSRTVKAAALCYCLAIVHSSAMADDIDIFTTSPGLVAAAPNVMFLLDNSTNWASSEDNTCAASPSPCPTLAAAPGNAVPAYNTSKKVGGNELNSMLIALSSLYTSNNKNISVGLATFTEKGSNQYGYVRFGARNIGDATGATAYTALMSLFSNWDVNSPIEKVNVGNKDEAESLYELYQYFNSFAPGVGLVKDAGVSGGSPSLADYPGNTNSVAAPKLDSAGANYTAYNSNSCGTGTSNANCLYRGPAIDCSNNFIIYIVNHGSPTSGTDGSSSYNGSPALKDIDPAVLGGVKAENKWIVEWAHYLHQNNITLYIVDVGPYALPLTNKYSMALQQAATYGGGKYYALTNSSVMSGVGSLSEKIREIFIEIQTPNSTFASVSLPINATTRTQNLNQVFIPMFRPDGDAKPLWKGNLKKYQLILNGSAIDLGDANGYQAVNPVTGFATPCAQSFWTTDSSTTDKSSGYWENVVQDPMAKGGCTISSNTNSLWSDSPDGPQVEKGGVAEVIRKGNDPTGATTWNLNRTIYTQPLAGGSLATFSSTSPGLATAVGLSGTALTNMTNFIRGQDVNTEYLTSPPPGVGAAPAALTRPSVHGDTIHSQPLPVTYSGTTGPYLYYGSNDGMLRSINGTTGKEEWAFVAPEFYSRLNRLVTQSPLISYPNQPAVTPAPTPKDYFFDGSIGLYQNAANTNIWIYPTMRRGGRMLYAFDVTNPTAPTFKWKVGCPNLTNDTGCSTGFDSIGQTWSSPNVAASVLGYSGPVIIMGGGYDACEDADTATPSCTGAKGAAVYVIDANTGALIKSFPTGRPAIGLSPAVPGRSVVADVALMMADPTQGFIDHAYAVDTGGNIYRIDFKAAGSSSWEMHRVAYTNGAGRKFMYAPALFHNPGNEVYLALGSGDREHPLQTQYPYTHTALNPNRFYVYRDDLAKTTTETDLDSTSSGTSINVSPTVGCIPKLASATVINQTTILPASTSNVWYLDLNQYGVGEQTVTSALIVGGMVTFSTNRPIAAASGSCSTRLGEARGYFMNLFNGSGAIGVGSKENCGGSISATFVGGGMPPSPVFANVKIGDFIYPVAIGAIQRQGGASSPISPQQVGPPISAARKATYSKTMGTD